MPNGLHVRVEWAKDNLLWLTIQGKLRYQVVAKDMPRLLWHLRHPVLKQYPAPNLYILDSLNHRCPQTVSVRDEGRK
jgi:hypothetical protein